jgi:hypothetical protein
MDRGFTLGGARRQGATAGLASAALALGSVVVNIAGGGVLKAPTFPVSAPMVPPALPLGHDGASALRLGSSTCDDAASNTFRREAATAATTY